METYIEQNKIISNILPNIFIGNYLAVNNEIIKMYNISGLIIAAHGIDSNSVESNVNIIKLDWMEQDDEDLYPGLIRSFGFIEEHLQKEKNVLVICKFGMNRSVTVVLGWLMMYKNLSYESALSIVKLSRPIIDPIPIYISKLINAYNSLKNEFKNWESAKFITSKELIDLFKYDIGNFDNFNGKYPTKFDQISKLSDETINMKNNKSIIDKAKNSNNRLRKDQPIDLIERNEKDCKLLLSNFYKLPKLKRIDYLNKVKLTNKFVLDLEHDALVNHRISYKVKT
jgi:hypothetical protein